MSTPLDCADPILAAGTVGLSSVAVHGAPDSALVVTLVPADALQREPALLDARSWSLTGGARLYPQIRSAERGASAAEVVLGLDAEGDFSIYTLTASAPAVDPFFASLRVRFRLNCEDPFDCRVADAVPEAPPEEPVEIGYLAKDYASFRQALLDFLPARWPDWTERSEADVGIMLLELLAATGDSLSYLQDRVANEAFLSSATQRRSLQGHLDLVGYELDQGAAARAWLQLRVVAPHVLPPAFTVTGQGDDEIVFETHAAQPLHPEQNELTLYDWGNRDCVLRHSAISAVVVGSPRTLAAGDHVVIEDTLTGAADVVRLVADPVPAKGRGGSSVAALALTELQWSARTGLSRDYRVADSVMRGNTVLAGHGRTVTEVHRVEGDERSGESEHAIVVPATGPAGTTFAITVTGFEPGERIEVAVRAGDGSLVSQGELVAAAVGGIEDHAVPTPAAAAEGAWSATFDGLTSGRRAVARWPVAAAGSVEAAAARRPRLRVPLASGPLAHRDPDGPGPSEPELTLEVSGRPWQRLPTLVAGGPTDEVFRIEIDEAGFATLAFGRGGEGGGDGGHGRRPPDGSTITVTYRVGGGIRGNVAARTLTRAENVDASWFVAITNPRAAAGGRDPETEAHARLIAPAAAQRRVVAVTAADYGEAAVELVDEQGRNPISRAGATFRWTGSWLTATLAVDPSGTTRLEPAVASALLAHLDARRLAGYDVQLRAPKYLPLSVSLRVCVHDGFVASEVERAVRRALTGRDERGGARSFFHPDNFSFGQPLRVSGLFAAVMAVPGVLSATIRRLAPLHAPAPDADTAAAQSSGALTVAVDEIVQLEDDPNFPEHGRLALTMLGGR